MQTHIFHLMAATDIMALPALTLASIPKGFTGLLAPFVYVSMLRSRYHSPAGAPYHKPVWRIIGQKAEPLLARLPPAARRPIDWACNWFTTLPGAAPARAQ